jgi:hypothetical protein
MPKRSAANIPTTSVWLSDVDVQLIQTIAIHKYMSALDVAYYHYEPTSHTYVRARLSRLAGGDDHCPNQYLYRLGHNLILGEGASSKSGCVGWTCGWLCMLTCLQPVFKDIDDRGVLGIPVVVRPEFGLPKTHAI